MRGFESHSCQCLQTPALVDSLRHLIMTNFYLIVSELFHWNAFSDRSPSSGVLAWFKFLKQVRVPSIFYPTNDITWKGSTIRTYAKLVLMHNTSCTWQCLETLALVDFVRHLIMTIFYWTVSELSHWNAFSERSPIGVLACFKFFKKVWIPSNF